MQHLAVRNPGGEKFFPLPRREAATPEIGQAIEGVFEIGGAVARQRLDAREARLLRRQNRISLPQERVEAVGKGIAGGTGQGGRFHGQGHGEAGVQLGKIEFAPGLGLLFAGRASGKPEFTDEKLAAEAESDVAAQDRSTILVTGQPVATDGNLPGELGLGHSKTLPRLAEPVGDVADADFAVFQGLGADNSHAAPINTETDRGSKDILQKLLQNNFITVYLHT